MPLYMDRHDVPGATAEDVAEAHMSDLQASKEFDVQFMSYWFDAEAGSVFCFANAPSKEALSDLHAASHGLIPNEIIDVSQDDVFRFLGSVHDPKDASESTSPKRTIMFTDLVGSTAILNAVGESRYMKILRTHDAVVREGLYRNQGREVKHTGDGIMASFDEADHALACALAIEERFEGLTDGDTDLAVRLGLASGQPVDHNDDIYGEAVVLASRLCDAADSRQVLVSESVRKEVGSSFEFSTPLKLTLKGFNEPVSAFELRTGEAAELPPEVIRTSRPSLWRRFFGSRN